MAIPVQNFKADTFSQANPGLTGASMMEKFIAQILQNRSQRLQNKTTDIKNQFLPQQMMGHNQAQEAAANLAQARAKYLPQQAQARISLLQQQIPLAQARAQLANTQAKSEPIIQQLKLQQLKQQANAPMSGLGKAISDYNTLKHQGSPMADALLSYIKTKSDGSNGLSVQMNKDGTLSAIQMGGPAITSSAGGEDGFGGGSNIIKNPMTASRRSGKGGSYTITYPDGTKKVVSTPTNQVTSRLQQQVSAVENVKPILNNLVENLPEFQRGETKLKEKAQAYGNEWLYQNNPLPGKFAQGQQSLELAPEALLKGYALNTTDYSMQTLRRVVQPIKGETPKQYINRITQTLEELRQRQMRSEGYLREGISIGPGDSMPAAQSTQVMQGSRPPAAQPQYSQEDLEYTAKQNGMTVAEVKKKLEALNAG